MTKRIDPVLRKIHVECGNSPEKWNALLRETYSLSEEVTVPHEDVQESVFSRPKGLAKYSGFEYAPTPGWLRSQAFYRVIARIVARKNKKLTKRGRAKLLNKLLKNVDDFIPSAPLPDFDPELWGEPEEFLDRWKGHLVDVKFVYTNRGLQAFELWSEAFPPDEPDDWDEDDGGAPRGHWVGLKWVPDPS